MRIRILSAFLKQLSSAISYLNVSQYASSIFFFFWSFPWSGWVCCSQMSVTICGSRRHAPRDTISRRLRYFVLLSPTPAPSSNAPPMNSVGPNQPPPHRCRAFPFLVTNIGHDFSAACECDADKQTVEHVVQSIFNHVQSIDFLNECMTGRFWMT